MSRNKDGRSGAMNILYRFGNPTGYFDTYSYQLIYLSFMAQHLEAIDIIPT